MTGYVLRRVAQAIVTVFAGTVLVWALSALSPGDPARHVLHARGVDQPHQAQVEQVRHQLGLDRPIVAQYVSWVARAASGDLGSSWRTGNPVTADLLDRLGPTARLTAVAVALGSLFTVPLATFGALHPGRWPDALTKATIFGAASVPTFVVGILILEVVVVRLHVGHVVADGSWSGAVLPALPLAVRIAAEWARVIRSGLDDALAAAHSQVATARGASRMRVIVVHGLPNAAGPWLAVLGVTAGGLLAGAAVVETLFSWPGIGLDLVHAIEARDLPAMQGIIAIAVLAFGITAALADLAAAAIDPRLRARG